MHCRGTPHPRGRARRAPSAAAAAAAAALLALALAGPALPAAAAAQAAPRAAAQEARPPSIEQRTAGMRKLDGFLPLYWDETGGKLFMEVPRLDEEVLYITGLASGLGSNDIGLDRGQLQGSRIVFFERVGPKVLLVQPNYRFRAPSRNPAEVRAVRDAFARSVLWGFTVAAETDGRVLVEVTDFLLRDATNIAARLRPGSYRLEPGRSAVHMPMTGAFPRNTDMEAELTFVQQPGGGPRPGGHFEGVGDVAATPEAASLRVHHSFVRLPDPGYEPRAYDPRGGYFGIEWQDYAAPLGNQMVMTRRYIARHRLEKRDPRAPTSEAVRPIVYHLDPGTPEPVRSALLEGARWWNQAFEAAGYRDAFRVEILPEDASPLDVRYNVITWVHRSTRGWSYGNTVTDPRTGEIIKGAVSLGSLRIRQDYMLAEGLLSPYRAGTETPPELAEWALARIRQLSAHEVGHTLGLGHNYYDSDRGRISVMDYPHPLVTLRADGAIDHSEVYERGIGEWDSVAIAWGYQDFPEGTDEAAALERILADAAARDVRYMTNQDVALHPRVDTWSNGTDAAAELDRMMEVRRVALSRFGEAAIRRGMPMATLEEVLVPLYLHHRYQVEAAASALGGQHYTYARRGDAGAPLRPAAAAEQRAALRSLLATIRPAALALPRPLLAQLPPRPAGWGAHRELFPRYTGSAFDAITPAVVAAEHTIAAILDGERAARLVEQHALDPSLPGLEEVLDRLHAATFGAAAAGPYEAEIGRAVERVLVDHLMALAARAGMPQVRAVATLRLERKLEELARPGAPTGTLVAAAGARAPRNGAAAAPADEAEAAHAALLARDIKRFLERPAPPAVALEAPQIPPGAPIGEPAMEWLGGSATWGAARSAAWEAAGWPRRLEPPCAWWEAPLLR